MRICVAWVTFAFMLLFSVPTNSVQAADASSDIPGTPLSGSVVRSSAGGPVTDRVWELKLEAGRVLLLRLEGSPGSELGLYLFDGFARTVVFDLPLKSSAFPGGRQYLSASLSPGTYYINVNGRNTDALYNFTMYVTTLEDQTPPSLAPVVVGGSNRISNTTVDLDARATDQLSGVEAVRARVLSDSVSEWGPWVGDSQKVSVVLPNVEGTHQVELQAKNGLGLISQAVKVSIVLDLTSPRAVPIGGTLRGVVTKPFANLAFLLSEPVDASTIREGIYVTDSAGRKVEGVASFGAEDSLLTFRSVAPLILGQTYIVDLVGVRDRAGNSVQQPTAHSFTYLRKTSLRLLTPRELTVRYGREIAFEIQGSLIPESAPLLLEWRPFGGSEDDWELLSETRSTKSGFVSTTFAATRFGELRMRYPGDALSDQAVSETVKLQVAARGSLVLSGPPNRPKAGTILQFVAEGKPTNLLWSLRIRRCRNNFATCTRFDTQPVVLDAQGRATITWEARRGSWDFRLIATGNTQVAGFNSARVRVTVQ